MTESATRPWWHELRPLRGAALLLLLTTLGLLSARAYHDDTGQTLRDLEQAERQGLRQYRDLQQDLQLVYRYHPRWRALQADPWLAPRRSHWLDALRTAAASSVLPAMEFQLSPPRSVPEMAGDGLQYHAMQLELELHHEFALVEFLSELVDRAQGLFEVRGCRLRRHRGPVRFARHSANVSAVCTLWWLSRAGVGL